MKILDSVDQRRQRLEQFLTAYRSQLTQQGTIVASWRRRGEVRLGPYYRLVCRDGLGRQHAVYLGTDGVLVALARQAVAEMQQPRKQHRQLAELRRSVRQQKRQAQQEVDQQLSQLGLHRRGHEIHGTSHPKALVALLRALTARLPDPHPAVPTRVTDRTASRDSFFSLPGNES